MKTFKILLFIFSFFITTSLFGGTITVLNGEDDNTHKVEEEPRGSNDEAQDYKFTVGEEGLIHITYKTGDDTKHNWKIATDPNFEDIIYEENSRNGVDRDFYIYDIAKDKDYYLRIEVANDRDELDYRLEWDYVVATDVEESEGVCNGGEESSGTVEAFGFTGSINGEKKIQIKNSTDGNITDIRVEYTLAEKNWSTATGCSTEPDPYSDDSETDYDCINTGKKAFFNFRTHQMTPDDTDVYIVLKTGTGVSYGGDEMTITYTDADGKSYAGNVSVCIEPVFCYDYAYEQNNRYFTEDNNGSEYPRLKGKVNKKEDIGIKFYISNSQEDANMIANNMTIDITDINTSQAYYKLNSTKKTLPGEIIEVSLDDEYEDDDEEAYVNNDEDDGNYRSFVNNIDIGSVKPNDRLYAKFKVNDINTSDTNEINMSLNISVTYSLPGETITKVLGFDDDDDNETIKMCKNGGASYLPKPGRFNIVHKDTYEDDKVYNIPTQVASRVGNFEVLSLEKDDNDKLKTRTTIAAVEIIDVSAFHYTEATCQEEDSTINRAERKWVIFNDSSKTDFNSGNVPTEFYQYIRRGAAFRVSFNTAKNSDTIELTGSNDIWSIENISDLDSNENSCTAYYQNQTGDTSSKIQDKCDDGNMTNSQLQGCMECLYGGTDVSKTEFICSRDNFSIRPEAFKITVHDKNQTGTQTLYIGDNESNLSAPENETLKLAAGYNYKYEINATNHVNSNAALGYTSLFEDANVTFFWNTDVDRNISGCNDDSNRSKYLTFVEGSISDQNISIAQVGTYIVSYSDENWTSSDWNPDEMEHHEGDYFYDKDTPDCSKSNTITYNESDGDKAHKNGCKISTEHNNTEAELNYRDYNLTFHPYKFSLTLSPTYGLDDAALTTGAYIYMNDISRNNGEDQNMSIHLHTNVAAFTYDNRTLSNFVETCYAEDINLTIQKDDNTTGADYIYRFVTLESNGTVDRIATGTLNNSNDVITLQVDDFQKDLNGSVATRLYLDFNRTIDTPVNPVKIHFHSYNLNITNDFHADLITHKNSTLTHNLNVDVTHYYGRSHTKRQRYVAPIGTSSSNPAKNFIYYEVYCSGSSCDKTLLQNGLNSQTTDDPRWFKNTLHSIDGDGGTTKVAEISADDSAITIHDIDNSNLGKTVVSLDYDGSKGYPKKVALRNNTNRWLIYNKYDNSATTNRQDVEFLKVGGSWAGDNETNTTTHNNASINTNRRSMW